MTKTFRPAGTLLYGRAMAAQLAHEMHLLEVRNPVMVSCKSHLRRARKAAAMLAPGFAGGIRITVSDDTAGADFLILAGGQKIADSYVSDERPKALLILGKEDLKAFEYPSTELTVVDSAFNRGGDEVVMFMRKFAAAITGGTASHPGQLRLPAAFDYSCRTAVYAGDEAIRALPALLEDAGVKHPMILTDKGIAAVGLLDMVLSVIDGTDTVVFDAIPPDSSSKVVNEISRIYTEKNRDGLIALGGGSVLDTGKGVYLNVSMGTDDLLTLAGSGRIPKLNTAFIAVPTTSGTGSEVTKVAVVNDEERKRKILYVSPNLQPDAGILDSRLTASLPPHLTSITGMDTLSHAVEAYTCLGKNPISDQMAWAAIELIRDNLIPVVSEPENLTLRRNLAVASNLAGQAFSNSMVGMVHTIGHSVGAICHAPHGSCMSVLLPYALEYNLPEIRPLLEQLLPAIAGEKYAEAVPKQKRAEEAIESIRRMNLKLRELTAGRHPVGLSDIKGRNGEPLVQKTHFQMIAETSLGDASIVYNPVELRIPDIMKVLNKSY